MAQQKSYRFYHIHGSKRAKGGQEPTQQHLSASKIHAAHQSAGQTKSDVVKGHIGEALS